MKPTRHKRVIDCVDIISAIVIIINAIALGLESDAALSHIRPILNTVITACIYLFLLELIIRLAYYRKEFFVGQDKLWNVFDAIIVIISFITFIPGLSSLRIIRILRLFRQLNVLRIIPLSHHLRIIVEAFFKSLPGVLWTGVLFIIIIYTFAILGIELYGNECPDIFGDVWVALFTLFQVTTFDSWASSVVKDVMVTHQYAWIYFISYIFLSAFIIMNLIVGIVLDSLQETAKVHKADNTEDITDDDMLKTIKVIEDQLTKLKSECINRAKRSAD
jgi:voltage-gated sodium channel